MVSDGMDVLIVGIDAGCRSVFERLFDEGRLPALESLCTEGVTAPLESQIPPWTPSAWPSLYTGVNPGKHGVFGFVTYDGYDWRAVTAEDVRAHRLWTLLDRHGGSSVVVNVPVTSPPDEIDGAIVPGFIGPEDPECHPSGVLDDVREAIGDYRVYPAYTRGDETYTEAEKIDEYQTLVRMRGEAFRYLADRFDPDLGFVQFQRTDTVFHEFGDDWEKIRDVYETTDEEVGAILDAHDPDQVFVVSDHGIGPYRKEEFRVNEFLRDRGYVSATSGGKGMPSWNPIRDQLRSGDDEATWDRSLTERLAATAARFGLTTSRISTGLSKVGLQDVARQHVPDGVVRTASEQVDFENSTAYMRARTELGVRLNVAGREPDGVVPPEEYERVRAELIDTLKDATGPDGDPVFQEVGASERYFSGPHVDDAVDIVTVPNAFDHFLSAQLLGETFGEPTEPWNHKLDGIFVAAGEDIDADADVAGAHLFDVAPTVMAALGLPADERMDGRVLPVIDERDTRSYDEYVPPTQDQSVTDSELEDRLADLGYIE